MEGSPAGACAALAGALRDDNRSVTSLNLQYNAVRAAGVDALAKALGVNLVVRTLFVGGGRTEQALGQLQREYAHRRDLLSYMDHIEKLT